MIPIKEHWNRIFESKTDNQKSWYEKFPHASIELLKELKITKSSSIIDVGGGDSNFVDALIELGYNNISILDISEIALQNSRKRLATKAERVTWIHSDILIFNPENQFDLWHDRAVFHFFNDEGAINSYLKKMISSIKDGGNLILATFAINGPEKCSGLPVKRYSQDAMTKLLEPYFQKIKCFEESHSTPFNTIQPFTYCGFSKKPNKYKTFH